MYVNDAKLFIKDVVSKHVKIAVMMHGSMGIGKSWIIKQIGDELGYDPHTEVIDLRLAQMEPADLVGIPRSRDGKTVWDRPEWFPDPKEHPKGILFLDELNRAPQDVRQAVFELVNEWKLHTHRLPPGWSIVSAVNPPNSTMNYQVEELDPAMIRRFCNIRVSVNEDDWQKWAHTKTKDADGKEVSNIDEAITGFISAHSELLSIKEDFKIEGFPNPDGYRMIDTLRKSGVLLHKHQAEIFSGLIGVNAATTLIKYIDANYSRPVSGKDVLDNYEKIKRKLKKQRTDEMHVTVKETISELETRKSSKALMDNLVKFIKDIPGEHAATVVHKLPKEFLSELMNYPDATKLVASLMKEARK